MDAVEACRKLGLSALPTIQAVYPGGAVVFGVTQSSAKLTRLREEGYRVSPSGRKAVIVEMPVGRFTVVGAGTGTVFATMVDLDDAAGWGKAYDISREALGGLAVNGEVRSHEDARGLRIRRVT